MFGESNNSRTHVLNQKEMFKRKFKLCLKKKESFAKKRGVEKKKRKKRHFGIIFTH